MDFYGNPSFRREGKPIKVNIIFIDESGQKRTVENVRIDSDKRKLRAPVKLQHEAVYDLEHDVKLRVAAVLKDEMSRYKKFGRLHSELGSLHVVYKGRVAKRIYQNGWTSSR